MTGGDCVLIGTIYTVDGSRPSSAEQIEADIAATRQLGAEELIFNALFSPDVDSTDDLLSHMEQLLTMTRRSEYVFEERR